LQVFLGFYVPFFHFVIHLLDRFQIFDVNPHFFDFLWRAQDNLALTIEIQQDVDQTYLAHGQRPLSQLLQHVFGTQGHIELLLEVVDRFFGVFELASNLSDFICIPMKN
jgi:hypothetical protein